MILDKQILIAVGLLRKRIGQEQGKRYRILKLCDPCRR
jgi:hypothetical protein